MARNTSFEMGLPPFRGAVREIIIGSAAIYVVVLLLEAFAKPLGDAILILGTLNIDGIHPVRVWQFLTYAFMYVDPMDFVLSLVGIYFLGYSVEERIRRPRFYGLFFGSVFFSALIGFALSFAPVIAKGPAFGSGAAANAILMVFYLYNRDAPIMLFPIPIQIPVKWIVLGIGAIETAYLLLSHFALFYCIPILGLGVGYVWYMAFLTRRQTSSGVLERFYGFKNGYYRWKRRRAARKFEVYMRQHDRTVQFDEHGNYIPPDDDKKNGGGKSGWVN
ncbi:MAG TPA: rhomboid family intramembrane serine protease [Terriglobales bacterium]|nr:rhomboid family intramembrane serine protease [Terriglobales bacterium]